MWVNGVRTVDERGVIADCGRPGRVLRDFATVKQRLPGPRGGFFFGSAGEFRRDQLGFYVACARQYGDFVQTRMGPYRVFMIFHPDAIEELLVARNRDFIKSPGVRLLRPCSATALLALRGRHLAPPAPARAARLPSPARGRLRRGHGRPSPSATWTRGRTATRRDVHAEMMSLTQAIVAKTLFDADVSGDAHEASQAAEMLMHDFGVRLQSFRVVPTGSRRPATSARAGPSGASISSSAADRRGAPRAAARTAAICSRSWCRRQDADDGTRMSRSRSATRS